jgi:hypothetical protein
VTHVTGRKIGAAALAAVAIGAIAFGGAASAAVKPAAAPGWRQVYSAHYGPAVDYSGYTNVVTTSTDNAWAFGGSDQTSGGGAREYPVAVRWNGRAWRNYALPVASTAGNQFSNQIIAVSAPAANDIWAVTWFGGWVLHWNGSKWQLAKDFKGGGEITGVTALSPTNVWVFGGSGFSGGIGTWHYNGKAWSEWHGDAAGLQRGSALGAQNIWAIGGAASPNSSIVHYTGTWRLVSASALSGLSFTSIQAFSNTNVWVTASGASGRVLVHYNGKWQRYQLPAGLSPSSDSGQSLFSDGRGGIWLTAQSAGGQWFLVHRTASGGWSRVAIGTADVAGVAQIPGTSSVWAVGFDVNKKQGGNAVIWADGAV